MGLNVGPDTFHEFLRLTQTEQEALIKAGFELEKWRLEQRAKMWDG